MTGMAYFSRMLGIKESIQLLFLAAELKPELCPVWSVQVNERRSVH